ncbi:MAG: hypothetical protein ABH846_00025 [Patescibacteria group bacterium]
MENERRQPTINDALMELAGIESQLYPTGAIDSEPAQLQAIRKDLTDGKITPEEAINRGRGLLAGRQDYH